MRPSVGRTSAALGAFAICALPGCAGTEAGDADTGVTMQALVAPVAVDDGYAVTEDTQLVVAAPGIFGNDFDGDGDPLSVALATQPLNGTLAIQPDGAFTYTPKPNFFGVDQFFYRAVDPTFRASNTATVTIQVTPVNDPPLAGDASYTVDEDTQLVVATPGVLGSASDVEGDPLTAVLVDGPANGVVELSDDGSFVYTPDVNFSGADAFVYAATDSNGALSNFATISVDVGSVNDAPMARFAEYFIVEDTQLIVGAPGLIEGATDPDGDPMTTQLVSGATNGVVSLNADGSFVYTPNVDFVGTDSFSYRVLDDQGAISNVASVTIFVELGNDAPFAADDAYTATEDAILTIATPGVLANDADVEGDPLTVFLVSGPSNGTVTLNADGSFVYIPGIDFVGADSFTYRAADSGGAQSNVATVALEVLSPAQHIDAIAQSIAAMVSDGTLTTRTARPLTSKLDAARRALAKGNCRGAKRDLAAFIDDVQSLVNDGTLSPAQGQLLLGSATALLVSLPC